MMKQKEYNYTKEQRNLISVLIEIYMEKHKFCVDEGVELSEIYYKHILDRLLVFQIATSYTEEDREWLNAIRFCRMDELNKKYK